MQKSRPTKTLSIFSLVMLNVIAVDSIRSLPFSAKYGLSLVFYYAITTLFFFIPTALVAAELATGWPKRGGIYVWVREAFGKRTAVMVIWLQWIYNVCWYPTIMSFIAATIAYMINPSLMQKPGYILATIFALFYGTTLLNCFGMRLSRIVSNIAAVVGSLLPMSLVIILGVIWLWEGNPSAIDLNWHHILPKDGTALGALVLMTNVLYSMVGMEMSAIHAQDVESPQKSYPKALFWSTVIIVITLVGGGLAIAIIVPSQEITLIGGMLQLFEHFFQVNHIPWMGKIMGLMIIIGALGSVSAWLLGPSKALMVAAQDGNLPPWLATENKHGAPMRILIIQAIFFTVISGAFIIMPSVGSAYWILSNITAILSLIAYLFMFTAALWLRYKRPEVKRAYRIPGGKLGIWIVCLFGLTACLATIAIGFLPPTNVNVGDVHRYEVLLITSVALLCLFPFCLTRALKTSPATNVTP